MYTDETIGEKRMEQGKHREKQPKASFFQQTNEFLIQN